jgi:hypothetical protein
MTSPAPSGPIQPQNVGGYSFMSCMTEANGMRALSQNGYADDKMTLESCATFCAGYTYWGTEYARECYCGNTLNAGSVAAPATDCNFPCAGNGGELCGAGNRLSVYTSNAGALSSSSVPGSVGSTSAVPPPASTSSADPTPTGLPAGWTYQGCWNEGTTGRALTSYQFPDSQTLTVQGCAQSCLQMGYNISGVEYSSQCMCGNAIYNGATVTSESACNMACTGNSAETCGSGGHLNIYSNGPPPAFQPPTAQTRGLDGAWSYQGCALDNVNQVRTFSWQLIYSGTLTPNICLTQCALYGYMAAGLEYGDECYCGDPANMATTGATFVSDDQCNVVCAGNGSSYCGGGSRLSTYFWTGDPLYSWTFPQDPSAAGSYDFLIGGLTVPLLAQQAVTGKVSFLSKWGTGPANETGAYELDLSVIDNFDQAWRTLHVKTDVFCSAGLILPDKAGRLINVGGWSGQSTQGLRIYWPDGSPGIQGTNDWQENVNELSLQVARWYPSAMTMANGSILVIGGEVGSNSAASPSLEILPPTGTPPLYMDWLARTDPNNLYPYCVVLPGGGIFVAYWNEARILDAGTFATVVTLPNMPGAVNDPTGGRTYPLEGTGVPMPQHAPYTDPLGILICGGSTIGAGNAIDNCVSTYPEAPNPTWIIERMPSARVMPCIAPLPDGTYLMVNGAQHGVAGFGLATNPNLNALLYDPSKPVGSRITVMANTTVARLYHSEAITLLDGRVLISGSDPQDGTHPEEYRIEVFTPPYLLTGQARPQYTLTSTDWAYGGSYTFTLSNPPVNGALTVSLLGAVSSTHGNSMGARTLFPAFKCSGTSCSVTAPPNANVAPPGWFQFHVLDGGVPASNAVYVRIGGDPAGIGNWPKAPDFSVPGV